jgi:hypothetical protein
VFNLTVESTGGLPAREIVTKAIELLEKKLNEIQVAVSGAQ